MRNFALLLVLATTACRGPGTKPVECGEGYTDCGDCVNLQNDPRHCGACDHACGSTEECVLGMCQLECGDGMHLCNGVCVSNGSTETCGARCTPCPTADGGVATCDGLTCGLTCEPQLRHCGAACATCPSGVGVKCMNELCVPSGCPLGQHLCDGDCVDENGGSCGEQCLRCPAPPMNGTAVCLNGGCEYLCRAGNRFCGSGCCAADFLEAGGYHSCMLNPGGGVLCWGRNHVDTTRGGALGNDSIVDHAQPFAVNGLSSGMVAVQLGEHHTCALSQLGAVSCWGYAEGGRLGDGSSSDKLIPMALTSLGTGSTIALSAGGTGGCALSLRGEVRCWGQNAHGEVGDGTTDARDTPTLVADLGTAVIDVSFGGSHACALMRGGTVRCWGDNSRGQLGDATQTERHRPALVMGVFDAVWLSAGEQHTCVVRKGGEVLCWGDNTGGQLGPGAGASRATPGKVEGLAAVSQVAAGGAHSCALLGTGAVQCWGANGSGQLGDGTTTGRAAPAAVSGLLEGTSISCGHAHTCAKTRSGARCWGSNAYGQLGDGTTDDRLTPVTPR